MIDKKHGGKREGAGRKALGDQKTKSFSVSLPPDLLEKVDALATATGKSRSATIVDLVRRALE